MGEMSRKALDTWKWEGMWDTPKINDLQNRRLQKQRQFKVTQFHNFAKG